jgi:mannose-6-phosphate isomerase-like protein (cupin superfamily)
MKVVDLDASFQALGAHWSPRIVGRVNDGELKVVTLDGDFVWHHHDETDECFLVMSGTLRMGYRDGDGEHEVTIGPGQLVVVPKMAEHRPRADGVCRVVLFERAGTVNTGSAGGERTVEATYL